jgi:PAS domain S-box-containing protein
VSPADARLLDAIIAAEPECVKVLNPDGTLRLINPAGLRILEADRFDQLGSTSLRQLVAEEDRDAFDNLARRVFEGESGVLEFRMRGLKGTERWIETHAVPLHDEDRRITALLAISRDVTDRRRTLDALRREETKYRALFEQATEGIFVCSDNLRFLDVNPAACDLTGYPRHELLTIGVAELIAPGDLARLPVEIERIADGAPATSEWHVRRRDGREIVVEVCAKRLPDGRIQAFARDVTDRAELNMRLLQAQKMESIGRLAGGIAHDFNNLLTVISGTVELALMTSGADNPLRADLQQIQAAADRGANLVGQLLATSRQQILRPEVLDVNVVLRKMDRMLRRLIGEDIALTMRLSDDPATVRADSRQLEQVILNLVLNSRDAMPDGGEVTIATQMIEADTNLHRQQPSPVFAGRHVMVSIGDTGTGMDEATRRRIFEPFFTTKEQGKGTGLGLSMVYGAVEQSGGTVVTHSAPGGGTTMRIYLPWAPDTFSDMDEAGRGDASPD